MNRRSERRRTRNAAERKFLQQQNGRPPRRASAENAPSPVPLFQTLHRDPDRRDPFDSRVFARIELCGLQNAGACQNARSAARRRHGKVYGRADRHGVFVRDRRVHQLPAEPSDAFVLRARHVRAAQGNVREDAAASDLVLRCAHARRADELLHERYRGGQRASAPLDHADADLGHIARVHFRTDVCAVDPRDLHHDLHGLHRVLRHARRYEAEPEKLQEAAARARGAERLHRRDDGRAEGREGLYPRGRDAGDLPQAQRRAVQGRDRREHVREHRRTADEQHQPHLLRDHLHRGRAARRAGRGAAVPHGRHVLCGASAAARRKQQADHVPVVRAAGVQPHQPDFAAVQLDPARARGRGAHLYADRHPRRG